VGDECPFTPFIGIKTTRIELLFEIVHQMIGREPPKSRFLHCGEVLRHQLGLRHVVGLPKWRSSGKQNRRHGGVIRDIFGTFDSSNRGESSRCP
jgi:hypothetical protein